MQTAVLKDFLKMDFLRSAALEQRKLAPAGIIFEHEKPPDLSLLFNLDLFTDSTSL